MLYENTNHGRHTKLLIESVFLETLHTIIYKIYYSLRGLNRDFYIDYSEEKTGQIAKCSAQALSYSGSM